MALLLLVVQHWLSGRFTPRYHRCVLKVSECAWGTSGRIGLSVSGLSRCATAATLLSCADRTHATAGTASSSSASFGQLNLAGFDHFGDAWIGRGLSGNLPNLARSQSQLLAAGQGNGQRNLTYIFNIHVLSVLHLYQGYGGYLKFLNAAVLSWVTYDNYAQSIA
jgi:hypothetical protein